MSETKTYDRCPKCYGTGICNKVDPITGEVVIEDPCINCGGVGYFESGKVETTEIMDYLNWIKKKIKKILQELKIPDEEEE